MAKKYLPIEAPEELLFSGYGPEDDDSCVESKVDNLDYYVDPSDKYELDAMTSGLDDGTLVFKYKLVGVGKVKNTSSITWRKK